MTARSEPHYDIVVEDLVIDYGAVRAVHGISFGVAQGEVVTLLGPSGCGKTSTLRAIAGLERHSAGRIMIGGTVVSDPARKLAVPPERRDVGMVFQSYALWPHMTVREAVEYPLKLRRVSKSERRERAMAALERVSMASLSERRVPELSGGQQQRVAIARAIVYEPRTLLLDEPLSNLDSRLRDRMRIELKQLQAELGITTMYVTHDQAEALVLSHRIIVMNGGNIEQVSAPQELYERPRTRFVSEFVGTSNMLRAVAVEVASASTDGGARSLHARLPDGVVLEATTVNERLVAGDEVLLTIRPERVVLLPRDAGTGQANTVEGTVTTNAFVGDHRLYEIDLGADCIHVKCDSQLVADVQHRASLRLPPESLVAMPANDSAWQQPQ